jgi:predicted RNA-binding protein with PUA-like domain
MINYWLAKTEPETFSWQDMLDERTEKKDTIWDGVRNYAARNNLRAMQVNDLVLIYHSVSDKCAVGIAKVSQDAFQDPSDESGTWSSVYMQAVYSLPKAVTLKQIKENESLGEMWLVRNSRLSVQPVSRDEFEEIIRMAEGDLTHIYSLTDGAI